jgi:ArsR family transcriptional regulator
MPNDRINLMFRAFSDPTRLRILHLLLDGEKCVGDLVEILRMQQPKVSRHLAYLRRAGLVDARRDGLWIHYSLTTARTAFQKNLVACLESCFEDVPEIKADRKRAEQVKKSGGCCPK